MDFPIYFNNKVVSQLRLSDETVFNWSLMAENEIPVNIELPKPLICPIGSHIVFNKWRYSINTTPSPLVSGDARGLRYTYRLTFEAPVYKLYDKRLRNNNNKTFAFTGDLSSMAYLIVSNANEIGLGWSVGITEDMGIKQVDFDRHTCRTALDKVAETFGCEWYISGIDGKTINFVKQAGNLTTLVFEYGMGKGLYELGYEYQDDKNIVTRAYGYGGSKNLPANYRNGATELMFDGLYLEKNVDLYSLKEGEYIDEEIFPTFSGVVGATSAYDKDSPTFTLTDNTLFFDLNTYFSPNTPKVVFQSGQLMGQEFEISKYDHPSRTLVLNKANDAAGNLLPGSVVAVAVGDKYTLIDMYMPDEVVAAAEQKLRDRTQEYLNENCVPRVLYSLELDPLYARDNGILLKPGDQIRVKDAALGIDALIRVNSVSYPVNFPEVTLNTKIVATIANFIPYTTTERIIADTIDNRQDIRTVNRTNAENARRNAANLKKLQSRIFNPDGSLFDGINSLLAGIATIGFDSQNFNLNAVVIAANNNADPNALAISAGTLVHYAYKIDGLGYIWSIQPGNWTGLDSAKFYFVFAKCSTSSLTGTWEISESPVGVKDIPGFYVFNVGILYEVNSDGYRDFDFTKGITSIVGDQVRTGRLSDISGQNFLDLTSGKFNLGDGKSGIDWDVTNPNVMTIHGAIASDVIRVGENTIISGLNDPTDPSKSIRWASGPNGEFMVLDNGKAYMLDAYITGTVNADSGKIGNYTINQQGLRNVEDKDAYIIQQRTPPGAPFIPGRGAIEASIGTNISNNGAVGIFNNIVTNPNGGANYGVAIRVQGGTNDKPDRPELTGNYALPIEGDIYQQLGTALFEGLLSIRGGLKVDGVDGWTGSFDVRSSASSSGFITLNFKKGLFIGFTS